MKAYSFELLSQPNISRSCFSEPAILSGDTGQRYPVLTAVNWSQHWCVICVQYQSSCAPKLARKCGIEHWFSCGADGRQRADGRAGRCTVTWLPTFLGWVDLLTHGAPQARFARQSSATNYLLRTRSYSSLLVHLTYKTEFLVFPLVQPAEHNTLFTRSLNLQTPVADFLLYLSQTCSGFGLPVGGCTLVQFGFPRPFLERYYVTHWLLGEMLRSPQYFSCSLNFYSTSNCFPPTKWLLLPWS